MQPPAIIKGVQFRIFRHLCVCVCAPRGTRVLILARILGTKLTALTLRPNSISISAKPPAWPGETWQVDNWFSSVQDAEGCVQVLQLVAALHPMCRASALRGYYQVLGYLFLTARSQLLQLCRTHAVWGPRRAQPPAAQPVGNSSLPSKHAAGATAGLSPAAATAKLDVGGGSGAELWELDYHSQLCAEFGEWKDGRFEATPAEGQATQLQVKTSCVNMR
jgi:hypothetical protein